MSNTNRLASLSGISGKRAALVTTIGDVLSDSFTKASFTATCHEFVGNEFALEVSGSNDTSWNHCFDFLRKNLPHDKKYHAYQLAFEYCMPESNCRADVVLLTSTEVLVMEFKDKNEILAAISCKPLDTRIVCAASMTKRKNEISPCVPSWSIRLGSPTGLPMYSLSYMTAILRHASHRISTKAPRWPSRTAFLGWNLPFSRSKVSLMQRSNFSKRVVYHKSKTSRMEKSKQPLTGFIK